MDPRFAKPGHSSIRIEWLVHIALCMWDESSKWGQNGTSTTIRSHLGVHLVLAKHRIVTMCCVGAVAEPAELAASAVALAQYSAVYVSSHKCREVCRRYTATFVRRSGLANRTVGHPSPQPGNYCWSNLFPPLFYSPKMNLNKFDTQP